MTYQRYDKYRSVYISDGLRRKQIEQYENLKKLKLQREKQLAESNMKNFKSRVFKKFAAKVFGDIILPILVISFILSVIAMVAYLFVLMSFDWRISIPIALGICVGLPWITFGLYDVYKKAKDEVEAENAKLMRDLKGNW